MKFTPVFLIAAMAVASVCADTIELPYVGEESCPEGCTDVYNPVTDEDGNTYSNDCQMQVAKCKREKKDKEPSTNGPFRKKSSFFSSMHPASQEDDCPVVSCPTVYQPVTDENGVTYPNECAMKAAKKCKDEKKKKKEDKGIQSSTADDSASDQSASEEDHSTNGSGSAPVSYCPNIMCLDVYEPVTDENGVTYPNKCSMKVAKCKGPHEDVLAEYKRLYGKSFGASRDAGDDEDDKSKPSKKCADACPDIVNPVCGSDGVKYANPCELKVAACKYPESNIVESACSKVTTQDDTVVRESSKSVKLD
ncbi:hypothetical protein ON010_g2689 [Phytophthora cinnamomi]|nr:hypothetical protein ON010_g2689 [Phytophthora cinnamomi]